MCAAIWMTGLAVQFYLFAVPPGSDADLTYNMTTGRPDAYSVKFMPLACFGGALWATGNTLSVPVINQIGLSLGLLIWGSSNMLMGWASGVFGLFGCDKSELTDVGENYAGVALAVLALVMYTQVKTADPAASKVQTTNADPLVVTSNEAPDVELLSSTSGMPAGEGARSKSATAKLVAILGAVVAGLLFGNNFTPPNYLMMNDLGPSEPMDYIFSHFTGIFATSTIWFVAYCCYMRGAPKINPRLVLPGMLSGFMWAIAQSCWFVANDALEVAVAFPIITSGPGIVSAMWGVFVFGEIRGTYSLSFLSIAIVLAVVGCILIGLSGPK